jgi:uncharacterized membrane protein
MCKFIQSGVVSFAPGPKSENCMSDIGDSPNVLKADESRRDDIVEAVVEGTALSLSTHSCNELISPPSTLIDRGSAGFPSIVPSYLASSSVVLCFFLRAANHQTRHNAYRRGQTSEIILLRPIPIFHRNPPNLSILLP